jgi:membrane-bound lytic murein transglycosylase D
VLEPPLFQETIEVTASTPVTGMAKCAGVDEKAFRVLNPSLRRFSTPPTPEKTGIHVPPNVASSFSACVAKIPKEERVAFERHRVRRGETLASIGAKYHVSVSEIVKVNRIQNVNKIYVGQELVIPAEGGVIPAPPTSSKSTQTGKKTIHVVTAGETLQGISTEYKVSPSGLMKWNKIANPNRVYVGQKLVLYGATLPLEKITVVIRRGDSLSKLAEKYGVSVADIQEWNDIRNASKVRMGQKVVIYTGGGGWVIHKVKRGDSLGAIATRYGCTLDEIKSWNEISGTVIHPGQELKIRK